MAVDVNFRCRHCGQGLWIEEREAESVVTCQRCEQAHPITPVHNDEGAPSLDRCWVCGCDRLYRQRDFNRKMGVGIVIVAAVFAVPTKFISLVVAAIIDLGLYFLLPEIALCYHCESIHRGFDLPDEVEAYDLATHERYEDENWGKAHEVDAV